MAYPFYPVGPQREFTRGVVTVYEYERALLYRNGQFVRSLGSGRYRLWPFTHQKIVVVDARRATADISNQKLLTADQITVTLNLVVEYEVLDAATALHSVADFRSQLYDDVQIATRNVVGAVTVDALLRERAALNAQILDVVAPMASGYGVRVPAVGIKDVILAPKVRDLLMKEAEARRVAQAMLIGAREEVATLRALANAARLAEQHPHLLRLRELEAIRTFAQTGGNTVVLGVGGVLPMRPPTGRAPDAPEGAEDDE